MCIRDRQKGEDTDGRGYRRARILTGEDTDGRGYRRARTKRHLLPGAAWLWLRTLKLIFTPLEIVGKWEIEWSY